MSANVELLTSVTECPCPVKADVSGKLPNWLQGCLLRIGPAKFEWGDTYYRHWFDGDGLLHRFDISNGEVNYMSQFVRSNSYLYSQAKGRITQNQFGTVAPPDPCQDIFSRIFSHFMPVLPNAHDNTNVNLVEIKDGLYACTEVPILYKITQDTLETEEKIDLSPKLGVLSGLLAHPHLETDGTYHNLSVNWARGSYDIITIPKRKCETESLTEGLTIDARINFSMKPSYYHSFGMTRNYFILFNNPLQIPNTAWFMLKDIMKLSFKDLFTWDDSGSTQILVIHRGKGKVVQKVKTEKIFLFHHVNSYEENGSVICDVIGYEDATIVDELYLHSLRQQSEIDSKRLSSASLRRFIIPLADTHNNLRTTNALDDPRNLDSIGYSVLCNDVELPRINYKRVNTKNYSFVYCVSIGSIFAKQDLVKINVKTKEKFLWSEENCCCSEPVFVETPGAVKEDDGVILSAVIGLGGKSSFLLVLDAQTFTEISRATIPIRFAASLHGLFVTKT